MPARTIDTAYVEILPQLDGLLRAQRDIERHLQGLVRAADATADDVEESFRDLTDGTERFFNELEREVDAHFDAMARDADQAANSISRDMERGNERAEDAFEELSRTARREMDQIERKATATSAAVSTKFKAMRIAAGAALIGIGVAATAGLGALATMGLTSAASLEQTQISFNALLGSAEEGQRVFDELQQFAATTPFEFPEVANAAKRFLAFNESIGLTDDFLQDFLTTIGDLTSVTGAGAEGMDRIVLAMGQMASKGKVSLEELMQIGEAVPGFSAIAAIAQELGVTSAEAMEMISAGSVDATTGINALLEGMRQFPGAAGAMEKQSETLLGVFSTFKDTMNMALAEAFEPVIPAIKDSLTEVTPVIEGALGEIAPALGQVLTSVMPLVSEALNAITPILTPILEGIALFADAIGPALTPLGEAFGQIFEALKPLMPILGEAFTEIIIALTPVITSLVEAFIPLVEPISDILVALMPLIPPLGELLAITPQLIGPIIELAAALASMLANEALVPVVELLAGALSQVAEWIEPVVEWLNEIDWDSVGSAIGDAFVSAWNAVSDFFEGVFDWFESLPSRIGDFLKSLPQRIADAFKNALKAALFAIGVGLGLVYALITEAPGKIIDFLADLPEKAFELFTSVGGRALEATESLATSLIDWAQGLPDRIIDGLKDLGSEIYSFFTGAWDEAKTVTSDAIDSMVQFVQDLPSRIAGFASSVASSIVTFFKNTLNTAIDAINSGIAFVDDAMPFVSIPRIPRLAHGGVAFGPALIGEDPSTSPEVALPLNDPNAMSMLVNALERATGGGVNVGNNITVIVEIDGQQLQGRIVKTIEDHDREIVKTVTRGRR